MPIKDKPTKDVKCRCGRITTVNVKPATAYCELTRFQCDCGEKFSIIDYHNGCITYQAVAYFDDKDKMEEATRLWKTLGDIPIDEEECIEQAWHIFPKMTDRETIWHWFEETFDLSVAEDLMGFKKDSNQLNFLFEEK